jgi:signal peptidase I
LGTFGERGTVGSPRNAHLLRYDERLEERVEVTPEATRTEPEANKPAGAEKNGSVGSPGWKTRIRTFWQETARPLLTIILILSAFRSAVADWNDVPSGSMRPTILVGDRIMVDRRAYDLRVPFTTTSLWRYADPQRGDIIVFLSPKDGTRLVKRVVGIPGDRVELRGFALTINGVAVLYEPLGSTTEAESPYVLLSEGLPGHQAHPVRAFDPGLRSDGTQVFEVPAGQYFALGDNRDESFDSRYWGSVPRDAVLGRAWRVAFSLDRERHFIPRLGRFWWPLA